MANAYTRPIEVMNPDGYLEDGYILLRGYVPFSLFLDYADEKLDLPEGCRWKKASNYWVVQDEYLEEESGMVPIFKEVPKGTQGAFQITIVRYGIGE